MYPLIASEFRSKTTVFWAMTCSSSERASTSKTNVWLGFDFTYDVDEKYVNCTLIIHYRVDGVFDIINIDSFFCWWGGAPLNWSCSLNIHCNPTPKWEFLCESSVSQDQQYGCLTNVQKRIDIKKSFWPTTVNYVCSNLALGRVAIYGDPSGTRNPHDHQSSRCEL